MIKVLKKPRIFAIIMAIALFAGQLPAPAAAQPAGAETADACSWYDANPQARVFYIGSAGELAYFGELVNGGVDFQNKTIILTGDIDLAGVENWSPVGGGNSPFQGTFDGAGHTVRNLTVNRPEEDYVGLFGCVKNAVVKNLGLAGGTVAGKQYVGGIAGSVEGSGKNFFKVGAMDISTIENCYNLASVTATEKMVGGIAGRIGYSKIISCHNAGEINGVSHVGGIAGIAHIVSIEKSWNQGRVRGTDKVGGILGAVSHGFTIVITDCYNAGDIEGLADISGIVGYPLYATANIFNCYNLPALDIPISLGSRRGNTGNCYFLSPEAAEESVPAEVYGYETTGESAKTAAAFNSGEVSWLLNMAGETLAMPGLTGMLFNRPEEDPALFNPDEMHSGRWGLGEAEVPFAGLEKIPVPADAEHPAIYRVTLINGEDAATAPGEMVCPGGEYVAAGDTVTLAGQLKPGRSGYVLQIESTDPEDLAISAGKQFTMPEQNVEIVYRLVRGTPTSGQDWRDARMPAAPETDAPAGEPEQSAAPAGDSRSEQPEPRVILYEITPAPQPAETSNEDSALIVFIVPAVLGVLICSSLRRYRKFKANIR